MKKYPLILVILLFYFCKNIQSQVVVYSAPFSGGNFHGWTNQNLTSPWGNFDPSYNIWKVNTNESGQPANVCGTTGAPSTLHMCSNIATGAAYVADYYTNRRIHSPNIPTLGRTNLTLSFLFISLGCLERDKAYLQYSIDGGTSWISPAGAPTSANPAMGTGGNLNNLKSAPKGVCSPQGRWTHLTWNMPPSCENINNLRVAFVWQNNGTGVCGTVGGVDLTADDPSFAVYNLTITAPDDLPVELLYFNGNHDDYNVMLEWATVSEINNDYFTIEKSTNGIEFAEIATIAGAGNSNEIRRYTYTDNDVPPDIVYYRLKQTDFDGTASYSKVIAMQINAPPDIVVYPNPPDEYLFVEISGMKGEVVFIEFIDMMGRRHLSQQMEIEYDSQTLPVAVDALSGGGYVLRIVSSKHIITRKIKIN